mmetsp:Transcript_1823/g.4668  ORF Transcript_1823/g.4668 Transcript_1823/m.4668 type:complete len:254 (-) Transcript_1823:633-1394(-)
MQAGRALLLSIQSGALVLAVANVLCQSYKGGALLRGKAIQLLDGLSNQVLCSLLTLLQAKQFGVRGLVHINVLACRLAQHLRGLGAIQDIVNHLEREANVARVLAQLLHCHVVRTAHESATHHGCLQQGCCLVFMDVLQHLQAHLLVFALNVHNLSSCQPICTNSLAQLQNHTQHTLRRGASGRARNMLKGEREQGISSKDGNVLSVHLVVGGPPSAEVIVVHGGQVIMDQAHGVHHLHGTGGGHCTRNVPSD